jgi:hypothetical protein
LNMSTWKWKKVSKALGENNWSWYGFEMIIKDIS